MSNALHIAAVNCFVIVSCLNLAKGARQVSWKQKDVMKLPAEFPVKFKESASCIMLLKATTAFKLLTFIVIQL